MDLYLDSTHIHCLTFTDQETFSLPATDRVEVVDAWLQAFYQANDRPWHATRSRAQAWIEGESRVTFTDIAGALISRLQPDVELSDLDVVILAHWTPDALMGCSVTNFILHQCHASQAFAFAVSDCGLAAPFTALELIDRYLPATQGKALLLIADQHLLMHESPTLDRLAGKDCGAALLFQRQAGRCRLKARWQQCGDDENTSAYFAAQLKQHAIKPESTLLITAEPQRHSAMAFTAMLTPQPALLCAAPFFELASVLQAEKPVAETLLLTCHRHNNCHVLAFSLEDVDEHH